jgi:hypothetical protein
MEILKHDSSWHQVESVCHIQLENYLVKNALNVMDHCFTITFVATPNWLGEYMLKMNIKIKMHNWWKIGHLQATMNHPLHLRSPLSPNFHNKNICPTNTIFFPSQLNHLVYKKKIEISLHCIEFNEMIKLQKLQRFVFPRDFLKYCILRLLKVHYTIILFPCETIFQYFS